MTSLTCEENECVSKFVQYLQIPTVSSIPSKFQAAKCVAFLKAQAEELQLPFEVIELVPGWPIVLMTWVGTSPDAPSLLLNSHFDVVPAEDAKWHWDPFGAEIDEEGRIYARGTQDMKCVGIQYLCAIRRLKAMNYSPKRTMHLLYVPDEEIGGHKGMEPFVLTDKWKSLNVGFVLDEGLASPTEEHTVFYGERAAWWIKLVATGPAGHGSALIKGTATEKLWRVMSHFMERRAVEVSKLEEEGCMGYISDVTTINLTSMKAGVSSDGGETFATNVIPTVAQCGFDIRVTPKEDMAVFKEKVESWVNSQEGVECQWLQKNFDNKVSQLDSSCPEWVTFEKVLHQEGLTYRSAIFPAATDSRYIRALGIPCAGFSPMTKTPILLHDHDEFLSVPVYLKGIVLYERLLSALGDCLTA